MSGKIPFKGIVSKNTILNEVVNNENRPEIPETLSKGYRSLIERCWSQEKSEHLSFEIIVVLLKSDADFINEKITQEVFLKYIEFIDESLKSFESTKRILSLKEFIKTKIIERTENKSCERKIKEEKVITGETNNDQLILTKKHQKILARKKSEKTR